MTTYVTIMNHGPDAVTVQPVGTDSGQPSGDKQCLLVGETSKPVCVWPGQHIEVKEAVAEEATNVAETEGGGQD